MVEHSCDFYFVQKCLSTIFLRKGGLFSKGFNCHFFLVFQLNTKIHCCKVAFSESFLGFEKLMEIELIDEFTEFDFPFFEILDIIGVKLFGLGLGRHELEPVRSSKNFLLSFGFGPENLEDGIKSEKEAFTSLTVFRVMVEETFGSEYKDDGVSIIGVEVVGRAEDGIGRDELKVIIEELSLFLHVSIIIINKANKCQSILYQKSLLFYNNSFKAGCIRLPHLSVMRLKPLKFPFDL